MASATATARSDRLRRAGAWVGRLRERTAASKLGVLILGLNLAGLLVLVVAALVLNESRRGLIRAQIDALATQNQLISYVVVTAASRGEPRPELDTAAAAEILRFMEVPRTERARLFDASGQLVADTDVIADRILERPLPPARPRSGPLAWWGERRQRGDAARAERAREAERREVRLALTGRAVSGVRLSSSGGQAVSVSLPLTNVKAVVGVLTLEAGDVDGTLWAQRRALLPFIGIAVGATLISSLLLNTLVARPILRLARAADSVRLSRARAISLPDIAARQDEVGGLTRALEAMTDAQSHRMDAIERFAADVAHEIRNPLTSIRSALETLSLVPEGPGRERLTAVLQADVKRLDRLITDIANASRLDAELSREAPRPVPLGRFLHDIAEPYAGDGRGAAVHLSGEGDLVEVLGREGPLGQVFRNLIDNARSFSPAGGEVRVGLARAHGEAVVTVDDDGPGVPPENLETVFERFYTNRPKGSAPGGSAFGGHSGLGLSIARQIVEAHGGAVSAANRPEGGARFTVRLPERRA